MTERTKQQLIKELKLWVPMIDRYAEINGFENFDFHYDERDKCWECVFSDKEGNVAEAYIAKKPEGIVSQFIKEPK